jgi:hypothetical protein
MEAPVWGRFTAIISENALAAGLYVLAQGCASPPFTRS